MCGIVALGYIGLNMRGLDRIPRQRMYVVLTLTFFSLLFWAFFEQAGSSVNNFTDRNVNRVIDQSKRSRKPTSAQLLRSNRLKTQLGFSNGNTVFTINQLDKLRDSHKDNSTVYDRLDGSAPTTSECTLLNATAELPASWFQSVNPSLHSRLRPGIYGTLGIFGKTRP